MKLIQFHFYELFRLSLCLLCISKSATSMPCDWDSLNFHMDFHDFGSHNPCDTNPIIDTFKFSNVPSYDDDDDQPLTNFHGDVFERVPFRFPTSEEFDHMFKDSDEQYADLSWGVVPSKLFPALLQTQIHSSFRTYSHPQTNGQLDSSSNSKPVKSQHDPFTFLGETKVNTPPHVGSTNCNETSSQNENPFSGLETLFKTDDEPRFETVKDNLELTNIFHGSSKQVSEVKKTQFEVSHKGPKTENKNIGSYFQFHDVKETPNPPTQDHLKQPVLHQNHFDVEESSNSRQTLVKDEAPEEVRRTLTEAEDDPSKNIVDEVQDKYAAFDGRISKIPTQSSTVSELLKVLSDVSSTTEATRTDPSITVDHSSLNEMSPVSKTTVDEVKSKISNVFQENDKGPRTENQTFFKLQDLSVLKISDSSLTEDNPEPSFKSVISDTSYFSPEQNPVPPSLQENIPVLPVIAEPEEQPQNDMFGAIPCRRGFQMDHTGKCRVELDMPVKTYNRQINRKLHPRPRRRRVRHSHVTQWTTEAPRSRYERRGYYP